MLDVRRLPHARASAYEGFLGQLSIWTIALMTRQKGKRLHIYLLVILHLSPFRVRVATLSVTRSPNFENLFWHVLADSLFRDPWRGFSIAMMTRVRH